MQNYCFTTYPPNIHANFFALFCNFPANSLICRCVLRQVFSGAFQSALLLHLDIIMRAYTHIHITLLPNPSPCSPSDGMDSKSFIPRAEVKGVKGWNMNFLYIERPLDKLIDASRRVYKFIKEFSAKHQEVFKKLLIFYGKGLSSIQTLTFWHDRLIDKNCNR